RRGEAVAALAGIGNPGRFYRTLEGLGLRVGAVIGVPDHGTLSPQAILRRAAGLPVVMTEKDEVKYNPHSLGRAYALGVEAALPRIFYDRLDLLLGGAMARAAARKEA
ncbi:MAG: tetraacyldisaccharide 4'-kinase, partial [Succinivibrionaceae bacterium]|nr:tetraacyldisaccharide 4'-kinase [Succinivibrionaceae bacterium]